MKTIEERRHAIQLKIQGFWPLIAHIWSPWSVVRIVQAMGISDKIEEYWTQRPISLPTDID